MMKPKVSKKFLVKQGLGLVATLALGLIVRLEHKIENRIDEHYNEPKSDQEDN